MAEEGDTQEAAGEQPAGADRPEWVPEKFWNDDLAGLGDGLEKVKPVIEAYSQAEKRISQARDKFREEFEAERAQSVPEAYSVEGIEVPEGLGVNVSMEDPMVQWFGEFAKENGLSQDQFNAAVSGYVGRLGSEMPDLEEQRAALGEDGAQRQEALDRVLQARLDEQEYAALKPFVGSAQFVRSMEKLMSEENGPSGDVNADANSGLTLDKLEEMMNQPEYWDPVKRDEAFVQKVTDGFRKLSGD